MLKNNTVDCSLTQYTIECIHLSVKINYVSQDIVFCFVFVCLFYPVNAIDSEDAEPLLTSCGNHRLACYTAAKLNSHWINAGLWPAQLTLSVSRAL